MKLSSPRDVGVGTVRRQCRRVDVFDDGRAMSDGEWWPVGMVARKAES